MGFPRNSYQRTPSTSANFKMRHVSARKDARPTYATVRVFGRRLSENSALPGCNGTGRLSCRGAPRPVPLHRRANMAQMKTGLYLSMADSWGSGQPLHRWRSSLRVRTVAGAQLRGNIELLLPQRGVLLRCNKCRRPHRQLDAVAAIVLCQIQSCISDL